MTGGAFGSMIASFSSDQCRAQDAAGRGRSGGMSATFATPVAAVLLAVELLLFEWKPRSLIPVALASATAAAARRYLLGLGPLFAVPPHPDSSGRGTGGVASSLGLLAGLAVGAADTGGLCLRGRSSSDCPCTGCGGRRSAGS